MAAPTEPTARPLPADAGLLAAVDIGTVSTRLIVARPQPDGSVDVLERQARITDLGEGVDASGTLKPAAVARTVACVADYAARIQEFAAREGAPALVSTTTTSAARDAANAADLLEPLRALGLEPQVIAGGTEASLALLGVTADFPDEEVLVADIGGGSTELTCGMRTAGGALREGRGVSYNVGCRRVTERFFADGAPATPEAIAAARAVVAEVLAPHFAPSADGRADLPATLVCVGGTATSLVAVAHKLVPYNSAFVHLRRMERPEVRALTERLLGMSAEERAGLPGLQPKRAGVIAAGALILDTLLDLGGWPAYVVSESDSLMGLLTCLAAVRSKRPSPIGWTCRPAVFA